MSDRSVPRRVLLSPHLDVLALSCAGALHDGDVAVTVFAGDPQRDGLRSDWDARCGASSSTTLMRQRSDEDRAAMALAGVTARHLPFAQRQHRESGLDAAALATALTAELRGVTEVWVPAAVHGEPDHALVRSIAFAVLGKLPTTIVWLYAEYPYHQYLLPGPRTVTAREATTTALAAWFGQKTRTGTGAATPTVHGLDAGALDRKRSLVGCYRSQLAPLDRTLDGPLLDDELLRDEHAWRVRG